MKGNFTIQGKGLPWLTAGVFFILLLPLVNLPPWFSPPDWGKAFLLKNILSIIGFALIARITLRGEWPTLWNYIKQLPTLFRISLAALLGLGGILFLASLLSPDSLHSFFGDPVRSGGVVNFFFYILFAIILALFSREADWENFWKAAAGTGILVGFVGIGQLQGWFGDFLISENARPPSTIGNPIFFGIYTLLLVFPVLSFALASKTKNQKYAWGAAAAFLIFILFLTLTRSAILGFFVGGLWFAFFSPAKHSILKFGRIVLLVSLVGGILAFAFFNIFSQSSFIQESSALRLLEQRFNIDKLVESRIISWHSGWEAFQQAPLLGYGMESATIGFDKVYDPSFYGAGTLGGNSGWWLDRAHNILLDLGTMGGIGAVLLYILFVGTLLILLERLKKNHPESSWKAHGLQAALIGYSTANFFSFDAFSTYLLFFFIVGNTLFLFRAQQDLPQKELGSRRGASFGKPVLGILLVLLSFFIWKFNLQPFMVNAQLNTGKQFVEQGSCEKGLKTLDQALEPNTFLDAYARITYRDMLRACPSSTSQQALEETQKGYELMKEATEIRPSFTRSWIYLGQFANFLAEKQDRDPALLQEADAAFRKAHELSPKRQEVYPDWIKTDLVAGRYEEAKRKAQECTDIYSEYGHCWWSKGITELFLHQDAKQSFEKAAEHGYIPTPASRLKQYAAVYAAIRDYEKLAETYEKLIEVEHQEVQHYAILASTYKELGRYEDARQTAIKAFKLDPTIGPQVEKFLNSLPSR